MSEFQIHKTNITQSRIVQNDLSNTQLQTGEVLLSIDKFALTANNVTYAIMGDQLGYWQFFPPHSKLLNNESVDTEGWGILPVWGFAEVQQSTCSDVPVGERLFGYFPPATHLIMTPGNISESSWFDVSEHRAKLPAGYNIYRRVEAEPHYNVKHDEERMLLYPLHITAFTLYDYFQENNWFGATQLIMLSASSKTSTGLAYGVKHHDDANNPAPELVALTSTGNKSMVEGLNAYDKTFTYDQITAIDNTKPSLIVDMSGNGKTLSALHKHLGDNMVFCSNVGVTHWSDFDAGADIIRERSQMFFAPSQIQKRLQDWGPQLFEQKSREYMSRSIGESRAWLKITHIDGLEGVEAIFTDICEGKVRPEAGLIVNMKE
jgi:hypothetical protein